MNTNKKKIYYCKLNNIKNCFYSEGTSATTEAILLVSVSSACAFFSYIISVDRTTPASKSNHRPFTAFLSGGDHQFTKLPKTGTCRKMPSCHIFSSDSFFKSTVAVSIPKIFIIIII